jgi:NAD-dependent deacetylase
MHHPVDPHDLELGLGQAAGILRRARRVAALTGAGVSAESGVPTFRGAGGLWEGHALEDVATPMAFERDPALVWRFYNARRAGLRAVRPNPGHFALKEMEDRWGSENFALITQNVDGLHRIAGSQRLLELHGSLLRVRCSRCTFAEERGLEELPELPRCEECGHLLRPAVVWFYEMLPEGVWREAAEAVGECECLLVVGTSAVVYPAAGLIDAARGVGAPVIEVNLEPTPASRSATVGLYGPSGEILPRLLERVTSGEGTP